MFHTEVSFSAPHVLSPSPLCEHPSITLSYPWAGLPYQLLAAWCWISTVPQYHPLQPGLCGFIRFLYFATGNAFSQLAVAMQCPESLSPWDLPILFEPRQKNGARPMAQWGKRNSLIGSDFRIQVIVFPGGVHCRKQQAQSQVLSKRAEINQALWSCVMGNRKPAFEHFITIFCNC